MVSYLLASGLKGLYEPDVNISSSENSEHIVYAVNHMLKVGQVFLQSFLNDFDAYYHQAISINAFNVTVLVLPYTLLIFYAGTAEKSKKVINAVQMSILLLICVAMWGSVLLAAYLWSSIGARELWGIQGRYMCPIIMIGAVAFSLRSRLQCEENREKYIMAFCMTIMMVGFLKIVGIQWV